MSRSMPRRSNVMKRGRLGLKTEESTLHSELSRFRDFQSIGIHPPSGLTCVESRKKCHAVPLPCHAPKVVPRDSLKGFPYGIPLRDSLTGFNGSSGNRTHDRLHSRRALYQLSYRSSSYRLFCNLRLHNAPQASYLFIVFLLRHKTKYRRFF